MAHHTPLTLEAMALLATFWLILLAAALAPAPLVLARLALRVAVRVALGALLGQLLKRLTIGLAIALAVAAATPVPAAAADACAPAATASALPASARLDLSVTDAFLRATGRSAKPIPFWLIETAIRIYEAYQTDRNGEKADEAARIAHAALTEVAHVRTEIEAGHKLTEFEQHVMRTRLEAHAAGIQRLDGRVRNLERRTGWLEEETKRTARIVTRHGCRPLHAWDRKLGRCTSRR
jgi:hypothetical protein